MATTDYGVISQRTAAYAAKEMLAYAEPILVLSKFGQNRPIPKNEAKQVKFRRPVPYTVSTTPLTEGVTPTAQTLTYDDVPATLAQYGGVTKITDVVADVAEDPVLKDASMLSGEQAAETIELVIWGAIKAGTAVIYSDGTARSAVASAVDSGLLRKAVRALKSARGKPLTTMLSGSVNIGTVPIEGGYIAFGHTDLEADIRNLGTSFTPVAEYGSRQPLCAEEVGSYENIRFILSPLLTPFAAAGVAVGATGMLAEDDTNIDVYPLLVVAKEAYGLVPLKGSKAITPSVLNPGTPSKSDPLGQVGFVGWKTYFTSTILNETWIQRIEVGATDL